jgi:hypothetical protein
VVYAATSDGYVHVTEHATADDPSKTWVSVGKAPLPQATAKDPGRAFSSLAVHPTDAKTVYLGVMGFGTGHVFKSVNEGETWKDISGTLYDAPVNWIFIDPLVPNDVYVANDLGVWVTEDGGRPGSRWLPYGHGLPRTAIMQLRMTPFGQRMLVAASHGRGAWGIAPLHNPSSFSLQINPNLEFLGPGGVQPVAVSIISSGGYRRRVKLTCTVPRPLECSLSTATVGVGESVQLILRGSPGTSRTTVEISGTDGAILKRQTVTLVTPGGN